MANGLPEIGPADMAAATVCGAVAHHGAVIVRQLFDPDSAAMVRATSQRARRAYERYNECDPLDRTTDRWFAPFETTAKNVESRRRQAGKAGGVWMADSPAATQQVLDLLQRAGVTDALEGHFGEHPTFSLQKSTLRGVAPDERITGWHQDGSFLSDDVRTMNVWIALSDCGGARPASGIEAFPRRFEELFPTDDAIVPFAVSFDLIDELATVTPTINPEFATGDALIFDERFLHRTSLGPGLTETRYALECWFFAPSHTNDSYVPFLA